jgi:hypothetical protein
MIVHGNDLPKSQCISCMISRADMPCMEVKLNRTVYDGISTSVRQTNHLLVASAHSTGTNTVPTWTSRMKNGVGRFACRRIFHDLPCIYPGGTPELIPSRLRLPLALNLINLVSGEMGMQKPLHRLTGPASLERTCAESESVEAGSLNRPAHIKRPGQGIEFASREVSHHSH